MAEKRINPLLVGGVIVAVLCLSLMMCSKKPASHQPMEELPAYDPAAKRQDGDTQTDTIKALQAYAREAVSKADALHASTESRMEQILKNQQKVDSLERENQAAQEKLTATKETINTLEQNLTSLQREITELRSQQTLPNTQLTPESLPVGFGFDDQISSPVDPAQGAWHNPIDWVTSETNKNADNRFTGLLSQRSTKEQIFQEKQPQPVKQQTIVEQIFTLPKDATLTDGLALTALIGRIPVEGQTPDPYPIKIYIGKENLLANGHELPEVEGMIFSGFGVW